MSIADTVRRALFNVTEKAYWGLQAGLREYPLGFFRAGITKEMGAVVVSAKPEIRFDAHRLVIPSISTAPNFEIGDIRIGGRTQRGFHRWQSAAAYVEGVKLTLDLDRTMFGDEVEIEVRNITDKAATFQAVFIGVGSERPTFYRPKPKDHQTTDRRAPLVKSILMALGGGVDPLRVVANRAHMTAFTLVERAYWGLHESGETCEIDVRKDAIAPGETVCIETTNDTAFEWDRFIAVGDSAKFFGPLGLVDLRIGRKSQFEDKSSPESSLPMSVFAKDGGGYGVRFDCSYPKQRVAVLVKNSGKEPIDFVGKLVGRPMTPPGARDYRPSLDAAAE